MAATLPRSQSRACNFKPDSFFVLKTYKAKGFSSSGFKNVHKNTTDGPWTSRTKKFELYQKYSLKQEQSFTAQNGISIISGAALPSRYIRRNWGSLAGDHFSESRWKYAVSTDCHPSRFMPVSETVDGCEGDE